ncbi:putative olfactory receptor 14L1 [Tachyglossus aculeatus]|uniref:putative olfactory receptor 14L1 n=1 Tax=Tachyglossus aculeatus TaxID=9261 RepID=UPI0018F6C886|nr:putative olfactory receptor 14L1 [Tachyglossus aculeatus]
MANISKVTEILLLGFSVVQELQLVHTALFLLIYLPSPSQPLTGASTPPCTSSSGTCPSLICVPKSILNSLTYRREISLLSCGTQLFFAVSELSLLTTMCYDRYAPIFPRLRYDLIMDRGTCGKLVVATEGPGRSWWPPPGSARGSSGDVFSRNVHIKLLVAMGISFSFISFVSIVVSYMRFFSAVLRFTSNESRAKAFFTCVPHLTVVTLFVSTGSLAYLKPVSDSPSTLDLLVSVFYFVVPPP